MSQTAQKDTKRWGSLWLAAIGLIAGVIGIVVGSQKAGNMCGSVFKSDSLTAEYFDAMTGGHSTLADCNRGIASLAVTTWVLIVLGVLMVLTAVLVWTISNSRPRVDAAPAAAPPSVASQMEDLSRLKEQGLITGEEFDSKRADLLGRL
jgi:hypothetical protein